VNKLVLLGGGILLLLGAVGGAVSFIGGGDDKKPKAAAVEPLPPPPSDPATLDLAAVAVPLVRDGRVRRYVTLTVKFETVIRPGDKVALEDHRPRLRDAIVREAHARPLAITADGCDLDMRDAEARVSAIGRRILGAQTYKAAFVTEAQASAAPASAPAARPSSPPKASGH
jgi:hypothetical protein